MHCRRMLDFCLFIYWPRGLDTPSLQPLYPPDNHPLSSFFRGHLSPGTKLCDGRWWVTSGSHQKSELNLHWLIVVVFFVYCGFLSLYLAFSFPILSTHCLFPGKEIATLSTSQGLGSSLLTPWWATSMNIAPATGYVS